MRRLAEKQLAAEKIIFDDPFVQAMMRDFGAKIVPGSIKPCEGMFNQLGSEHIAACVV
jgi:hypothetical protein